jgi:hypothetical protein
MNKAHVIAAIIASLRSDLDAATAAAKASASAASDPDSKAENKYDTRNLEASYVARGQADRVEELQQALRSFEVLQSTVRPLVQTVEMGCLLTLGADLHYFLGPTAGGTEVTVADAEITVITPASPLSQRLMGRRQGQMITLPNGRSVALSAVA